MRKATSRGSLEPKVMADLDNRGVLYAYEPFSLKYTTESSYTPDLVLSNGIIVEIKGKFDRDDQRKMDQVVKQHPDKDIRMVFQRLKTGLIGSAKRKDGTRMTHQEWADRRGIKCAEMTIPEEWLETYYNEEQADYPGDEPFREQGDE